MLAYLSTFDAIFASCCHTLACEPHQPTCFIPCHLCRSNMNSGDWRCLPIGIAALALFGWQHCLLPCWHLGFPQPLLKSLINLHSSFLAILQATQIVGLALLADLHCDVGVVEVGQCCCHAGIMACQHYLCHGALLLPSIACQPLVQVALWSLLCKLLLPTCTCMFACHVACMHDSTSRDMQHAQYIGCAVSLQ